MPNHYSLYASHSRFKVPVTISQTPTVTAAGAYTAKDAVGGLLTFANAADVNYGSGTIKAVVLIDNDSESAAMQLHLFDRTFTASTDNAIFSPSDADLLNYIGSILVTTYTALEDNATATVQTDLHFNLVSGGTSLFGQLATTGTPTYTATSDITVKLVVMQD